MLLYISVLVFILVMAVGAYLVTYPLRRKKGRNPFQKDVRRPNEGVERDMSKRDQFLKKVYKKDSVPQDTDVIIIGSGIGGLAAAVLLAKAGKKVAVLEQHTTAGGCCHTFFQKGFEFDSGIHYVGYSPTSISLFMLDQLTEGQMEWEHLHNIYDMAIVKDEEFPLYSGRENLRKMLDDRFPDSKEELDRYFHKITRVRKTEMALFLVKLFPMWFMRLIVSTGVIKFMFGEFFELAQTSVADVVNNTITDPKLRAVLMYQYGDYGCVPSEASFAMHGSLVEHYIQGALYPKGGSSEVTIALIKALHKTGNGVVLVKGRVRSIEVQNGRCQGVIMDRDDAFIPCKTVVSDAGLFNTFEHLVPSLKPHLAQYPLKDMRQGFSSMCLFIGLNGSAEELNVQATNYWLMKSENIEQDIQEFLKKTPEELLTGDWELPVCFASFPSTKDSIARERHPNKTTCTVVALSAFEWFTEWCEEGIHKRGTEYESLKGIFSDKMWNCVLKRFPQLADKVEHMDAASPLTNKYFLNSQKGEIYGLDHTVQRFSPMALASLRSPTPVEGLCLTGQDVVTCGFSGALYGALLASSEVLERNVLTDVMRLKKSVESAVVDSDKKNK